MEPKYSSIFPEYFQSLLINEFLQVQDTEKF